MFKTVFKVFLGLCSIIIGYNISLAQERIYHEDALYGLKGNVSEVKTKSKTQLPLQNEFKFNNNGRLSLSTMTYNDSGYPIGYNITNGKSFADHRVIWNENKTPKSINTYSTLSPSKYTQTIEFFLWR